MPDLREQLRQCFQGRVCMMGLGNVEYGDDGFGAIGRALSEGEGEGEEQSEGRSPKAERVEFRSPK